jgi:hypothetical protein
MAKTIARTKRVVRRDWTRADVKELRQHSKDKTRVRTISRALKRTASALRQKARALGIPSASPHQKKRSGAASLNPLANAERKTHEGRDLTPSK